MNENKKKEKHALRNVLITLLVLCVLGGGGYFGYTKYQEYKTNQEIAVQKEKEEQEAQEKLEEEIDVALKGVSEEDASKLTESNLKALAGGTTAGQERALNNYGIAADVNERMETIGNYSTSSVNVVNTTIEENTLANCNEEKAVAADGTLIPIQVSIGEEDGFVLFDRLYDNDYSNVDYEYCEGMGISKETVDEVLANYPADPNAIYKTYELYNKECDGVYGRLSLKNIMVSSTEGESRFIIILVKKNQGRLVLY